MSRSERLKHNRLSNNTVLFVRGSADLWLALVDGPADTFTADDVPDCEWGTFMRAVDGRGIFIRNDDATPTEYRLCDAAWEIVSDTDAHWPCGHSGIDNRGDHYRCGCSFCDAQWSREDYQG